MRTALKTNEHPDPKHLFEDNVKSILLLFTKNLSCLSPCNQLVQLLRLVNFTVFYLGPLLIAYTALQANLARKKSQKAGSIFEEKKVGNFNEWMCVAERHLTLVSWVWRSLAGVWHG
jgi:hypothetical protein